MKLSSTKWVAVIAGVLLVAGCTVPPPQEVTDGQREIVDRAIDEVDAALNEGQASQLVGMTADEAKAAAAGYGWDVALEGEAVLSGTRPVVVLRVVENTVVSAQLR